MSLPPKTKQSTVIMKFLCLPGAYGSADVSLLPNKSPLA